MPAITRMTNNVSSIRRKASPPRTRRSPILDHQRFPNSVHLPDDSRASNSPRSDAWPVRPDLELNRLEVREKVLRLLEVPERLVRARDFVPGPHRPHLGILVGRFDRGPGFPFEHFDERAVGGSHQVRRSVRDEAFLSKD